MSKDSVSSVIKVEWKVTHQVTVHCWQYLHIPKLLVKVYLWGGTLPEGTVGNGAEPTPLLSGPREGQTVITGDSKSVLQLGVALVFLTLFFNPQLPQKVYPYMWGSFCTGTDHSFVSLSTNKCWVDSSDDRRMRDWERTSFTLHQVDKCGCKSYFLCQVGRIMS